MAPMVALAMSVGTPGLETGTGPLVEALDELGIDSRLHVWDDPGVAWDEYDLVMVRSVYDYSTRRDEFLAWVRSVPRLENPAAVLDWNSDKHYLKDLEDSGVPVVPTTWLEPEQQLDSHRLHTRFPSLGDFVIKPAIGAGSNDVARYTAVDGRSRGLAIDHAHWLLDHDQSVLVQRYIKSVDVSGERALYFIDGEFSHALHKEPMLTKSGEEAETVERLSPTDVSDADIAIANAALQAAGAAVPINGDDPLLYARVDLISGDSDEPLVLELELVKSAMGIELVPGVADRLAKAIQGRIGS